MISCTLWKKLCHGISDNSLVKRGMEQSPPGNGTVGSRRVVRAIAFYRSQGFELIGYDNCCYTNMDVERHEVRFIFGYFFHKETFMEIDAFIEGKSLDKIEKAREEGKRAYQKVLLAVGSAVLAIVSAWIMTAVMKMFL